MLLSWLFVAFCASVFAGNFRVGGFAILSNNFVLGFARNEDGRLRMRADINMEGPEYSGRKSSRLAAFESNGEELPVSQSLMGANGKGFNFEYEDEDDDDLLVCTVHTFSRLVF